MPDRPVPPPEIVNRLRAAGCVFAEDEATLLVEESRSSDDLAAMLARRVAGEPLEQVLGWVEFWGLRLAVEPGVFVPRRRTELMVREALVLLDGLSDPVAVDLCCGCGAVAAAMLDAMGGLEVHACDIDPAAVACARRNLPPGQVHRGDLLDALPARLRGRVDVLTANTPYVPTRAIATMPPEARDHEPAVALDGGVDGLDVARRVAAAAPAWLAAHGSVIVETSEAQAPVLAEVFETHGLSARVVSSAELDATMVVGRST